MIKIKQLDELLRRQMSRKEFLQSIGLMLLSLVGITRLIHGLVGLRPAAPENQATGYGESSYGEQGRKS